MLTRCGPDDVSATALSVVRTRTRRRSEAQARPARHLQPGRRDRQGAPGDHRRGRGQAGAARRDHPGQGVWSAEEARVALPRPEGDQSAVSPGREGLRQLRPGLRALPMEVARPRVRMPLAQAGTMPRMTTPIGREALRPNPALEPLTPLL